MVEMSVKFPTVSAPLVSPIGESKSTGGTSAVGKELDKSVTEVLNERKNVPADAASSLSRLAEALDRFVPKDLPNTKLQIDQDDGSGQFVYKAVDQDSGEVVRQYPSEEILRFISFYREREGLLVDGRA